MILHSLCIKEHYNYNNKTPKSSWNSQSLLSLTRYKVWVPNYKHKKGEKTPATDHVCVGSTKTIYKIFTDHMNYLPENASQQQVF